MIVKRSIPVKIIIVFTAWVLLFVSVGAFKSSADEIVSLGESYNVYNANTGALLRSYTLSDAIISPNNNGDQVNTVIGTDDRYIDWSMSAVVKIITNGGFGTGFIVDDHTIATAAHCVYNTQIINILLFNSNGAVSQSLTAVEYHVPIEYINQNENDYALITVSNDLSSYCQFQLGSSLPLAATLETQVTVTGFPGSASGNTNINTMTDHNMLTGIGTLLPNTGWGADLHILYTKDASGGNSGGPVYVNESFNNTTYYTVIGINVSEAGTYNIGTKLNSKHFKFYLSNTNLIY